MLGRVARKCCNKQERERAVHISSEIKTT